MFQFVCAHPGSMTVEFLPLFYNLGESDLSQSVGTTVLAPNVIPVCLWNELGLENIPLRFTPRNLLKGPIQSYRVSIQTPQVNKIKCRRTEGFAQWYSHVYK